MKTHIDLGNKNYKLLIGSKRIIDNSNIQEVSEGTFGAWIINNKHYLNSENAKSKKNTNKITEEKKRIILTEVIA